MYMIPYKRTQTAHATTYIYVHIRRALVRIVERERENTYLIERPVLPEYSLGSRRKLRQFQQSIIHLGVEIKATKFLIHWIPNYLWNKLFVLCSNVWIVDESITLLIHQYHPSSTAVWEHFADACKRIHIHGSRWVGAIHTSPTLRAPPLQCQFTGSRRGHDQLVYRLLYILPVILLTHNMSKLIHKLPVLNVEVAETASLQGGEEYNQEFKLEAS